MEERKAFLLFCLKHFGLKVIKEEDDKLFFLEQGYCIELESNGLLKLLHAGQVIAPFSDVEELCDFIQQDMRLQNG